MGKAGTVHMSDSKAGSCLVVLFVLLSTRTCSATSPTAYRHRLEALRTHLLSNYSNRFPPFEEEGEPFSVDLQFSLISVLGLDAVQQTLTTVIYLGTVWTDPDLSWDPRQEGSPGEGISTIEFNSDEIWTPTLLMSNKVGENMVMDYYASVLVTHAGLCNAQLPMQLSTTCQLDVTRYPFDTQTCKVSFAPVYGDNLLLTGTFLDLPLKDIFQVSGEWKVKNITSNVIDIGKEDNFDVGFLEFHLVLERQYVFYVLTVLIPMMILSLTGACGFLLPAQCGEKVSFQVSIMVSLSVFLSFINDAIPKTSDSISRLAVYLDLLLLQSCLSLLATLTVLRGHYHHERLDQQEKEQGLFNGQSPPDDQTIAREPTANGGGGGYQAMSSRATRFWTCLRRVIKRWYCCNCCCVPPKVLDIIFFVVFFTASLLGPFVIVV